MIAWTAVYVAALMLALGIGLAFWAPIKIHRDYEAWKKER